MKKISKKIIGSFVTLIFGIVIFVLTFTGNEEYVPSVKEFQTQTEDLVENGYECFDGRTLSTRDLAQVKEISDCLNDKGFDTWVDGVGRLVKDGKVIYDDKNK